MTATLAPEKTDNTTIPSPITDHSFGPFDLRCYQRSIRSGIYNSWDSAFGQLIVAPTGSGKTITALACCRDWMAAQDFLYGDEEAIVVWVAMRTELYTEASKVCKEMGLPSDRYHFLSMFGSGWEKFAGKRIMFVIDEAHHAACDTAIRVKLALRPEALLGMSATPVRADQMVLGFERTIFESNYDALVEAGYLSRYDHYQLPDWHPEMVAAAINGDPEKWGKSAVFFRNKDECKAFINHLSPDIRADFVHGGVGAVERESMIRRFKASELDVLVNVRILTEGFDDPSMKTVFVDPSLSEADCVQKSGRVMRLWNGTRKQVVQCAGYKTFADVATPETRFTWHNNRWNETEDSTKALMDNMVNFDDLDFGVDIELSEESLRNVMGC